MGQISTPSPTPPSCADCATKTQPAGGGAPTQSASRMWRSSDGKFRLDTPTSSVISDPGSQQAILLDHAKKEATVIPMTSGSAGATVPGMPQAPLAGGEAPAMHVQDLGKSMIEGHEVEGKRFTLTPPPASAAPKMPAMKIPGAPKTPSAPGAPKPPQMPKLLAGPSVTEVWSSVKLKIPVLTKVTTPAGEQTTYCKPVSTDEPHPSTFQIPPGYKIKPPTIPKPPSAPKIPSAAKMPATPKIPSAKLPTMPKPPKSPKLPTIPKAPKPPKV